MDWQTFVNGLSLLANAAQFVTGAIAAFFGCRILIRAYTRRVALENYLQTERKKDEGPGGQGHGSRTLLHLMAHLAMTEPQILEAAFGSRQIKQWPAVDEKTGRADALFLQYDNRAITTSACGT